MGEAQWLRTDEDIRDAVEVKAKKYGELSLPLVVAVNVKSEHCDNVDVNNALFGDETIELTPLPDKSHLAKLGQRRPNGIWLGSAGPRNRLVSAILIGCDITVYTCAIRAAAEVVNLHGRLASKEAWVTNARRRLPRYSPEARRGARGPEIADRGESSPTRG